MTHAKYRRFRIERVAKTDTEKQNVHAGNSFVDLPLKEVVRNACRIITIHPETRVCFFAVPIVVLLTFEMLNCHILGEKFWHHTFVANRNDVRDS